MKKILFSLVFLMIVGSLTASNADLFKYDHSELNNELVKLNNLEEFVLLNEGITLDEMVLEGNELAQNVVGEASGVLGGYSYGDPWGFNMIYYGCVLLITLASLIYFIYWLSYW